MITGLSGAGKSTLAKELQIALEEKSEKYYPLGMNYENFHQGSNSQHQYTREMRLQLAMQYSKLARLLSFQVSM